MVKKGIVIDCDGKKAVLMTTTGEFLNIVAKEKLEIGQEYIYRKNEYLNYKNLLIAASLVLFILSSLFYNMYNVFCNN